MSFSSKAQKAIEALTRVANSYEGDLSRHNLLSMVDNLRLQLQQTQQALAGARQTGLDAPYREARRELQHMVQTAWQMVRRDKPLLPPVFNIRPPRFKRQRRHRRHVQWALILWLLAQPLVFAKTPGDPGRFFIAAPALPAPPI